MCNEMNLVGKDSVNAVAKRHLASVLASSSVAPDAEKCADELLDRYGSLDLLLSRDVADIASLVGESRAILIKLLAYVSSRRVCDGFKLGAPHSRDEIAEMLKAAMLGLSRETVYLVSENASGDVIAVDMIGEGTINSSDVYPRRLVECALKRGAASVYLAHNHPSGTARPSADDLAATSRIFSTFRVSGVILKAHIIISARDHTFMVPDLVTGEIKVMDKNV